MLLINFSILCLSFWCGAKVYNRFIKRAQINQHRFKFFALRDRLTVLVLQRNVSTNDIDYQVLLGLLNRSIKVFDENYTFASLFIYLSSIVSNKEEIRGIDKMIKQLKTHHNVELVSIAREYFELNHIVFNAYTKRTPLAVFLKLLSFVASQPRKQIELQEQIDARLENSMRQLSVVYA